MTWDRVRNVVTARDGAARLAILNAGTIPDRGLYGVFLAFTEGKSVRVGELDEEMVFESHPNETFILGASTWRIVDITHDRVLVTPAPGEPGKMPFWKGDGPGRPLEFGRRIGAMVRELRALPQAAALTRLVNEHDLDPGAAENLLRFLADQAESTGQVPDDRTIVVERCRDELGDWRVCVLTPFGSRIHIPWAMAVSARIRAAGGPEVETLWGDDGFVLRFPDTDEPPDADWILVEAAEAMQLVLRQLGSTALFAGRFREAAGRALLLPRRRADQRSPLWQLRKRSYDLLSVASRYPSFPLLLEAYRECLRDVFDMPALIEILQEIEQRKLRVHVVETRKPSPFASSLLFSYVANFLYEGDAPLAERRAQALSIDQDQLRELLGEADLRELLDADAIAEVEEAAQCLAENYPRALGGWHARSVPEIGRPFARRIGAARGFAGVAHAGRSFDSLAAAAGAAHCRRKAADCRRRRRALSRWVGHSLAAGAGGCAAGAGGASGARTGAPLRAHAWAVHAARGCGPICAGRGGSGTCAAATCGGGPRAGRRLPAGRASSRVVRCGDSAADSAQVAGPAAPRSGTGGAAHAGALPHALAGTADAAAHGHRASGCAA